MDFTVKSYNHEADHERVGAFLRSINHDHAVTPHYLWGRWSWQFGPYMNPEHYDRIGLFEVDGEIVGLATYENDVGEAYLCADEKYPELKAQLVAYAAEHLADAEGKIKICLPDGDAELRKAAQAMGFVATEEKGATARLEMDDFETALPEGFRFITFADPEFDAAKYYDAIWRGFDNERPRNEVEQASMDSGEEFVSFGYDMSLRIMVVAPNGDYAAHCGMWYADGEECAYVEPVFTVPEYRRMGLAKAAVLEGSKRCGERGAKCSIVLSSQQFYYNIGFYPYQNETWWVKK